MFTLLCVMLVFWPATGLLAVRWLLSAAADGVIVINIRQARTPKVKPEPEPYRPLMAVPEGGG